MGLRSWVALAPASGPRSAKRTKVLEPLVLAVQDVEARVEGGAPVWGPVPGRDGLRVRRTGAGGQEASFSRPGPGRGSGGVGANG